MWRAIRNEKEDERAYIQSASEENYQGFERIGSRKGDMI
jgi:hypothetical protein